MQKVPEAGYEIKGLPVAGLQRSLTLDNLSFPIKLLKSLRIASGIVKDFRPDAVVGVGGYASGPILYAAQNKSIPTLIQEQNSYAGLTNKLLSKKAKTICVAYPAMEKFFPAEKKSESQEIRYGKTFWTCPEKEIWRSSTLAWWRRRRRFWF